MSYYLVFILGFSLACNPSGKEKEAYVVNNTNINNDSDSHGLSKTQGNWPADKQNIDIDSISIQDTGKVYSVLVLDSVIFYTLFISEIPETDIGREYLKVKNKNGVLLWSQEIKGMNKILGNNEVILLIDMDNQIINIYATDSGTMLKKIKVEKEYKYSDANEAILLKDRLLFTLVDESDYKIVDVVSLNLKTHIFQQQGYKLNGYYNLKKSSDNKTGLLLDENNQIIKEIKFDD